MSVLRILALTELAGLVMFLTIEFFEHMDVFTSSLFNFAMSILYLALRMPYYVHLILPLAFLISMLVLLILMVRGNEIVAVRTAGISTAAFMKPFVIISLVLAGFSFLLSEWVIPTASTGSEYVYRVKIKKEEPNVFVKNDRIWFKREYTISNIDYFDTKKDLIKGLTVLELGSDYTIRRRYDAREGVWREGAWVFSDVVERTFDENGKVTRKTYKSLRNLLHEPPAVFKVAERNPEEMGYKELSKYIMRLQRDGHDIRRYLVDLYNKVAFPFINLVMVFAAVSVGFRYTKTRNIARGVFMGICLGILYWFFHSVSLSLGYSEIFPPLFAAWFSNLVFLSAGIVGVMTLRT